jgi:hypothetical protein
LGKRELNFHHAVTPYLSCLKHFRKFEIEDFTTSPLTIQLAERILENNKETLTYVNAPS